MFDVQNYINDGNALNKIDVEYRIDLEYCNYVKGIKP